MLTNWDSLESRYESLLGKLRTPQGAPVYGVVLTAPREKQLVDEQGFKSLMRQFPSSKGKEGAEKQGIFQMKDFIQVLIQKAKEDEEIDSSGVILQNEIDKQFLRMSELISIIRSDQTRKLASQLFRPLDFLRFAQKTELGFFSDDLPLLSSEIRRLIDSSQLREEAGANVYHENLKKVVDLFSSLALIVENVINEYSNKVLKILEPLTNPHPKNYALLEHCPHSSKAKRIRRFPSLSFSDEPSMGKVEKGEIGQKILGRNFSFSKYDHLIQKNELPNVPEFDPNLPILGPFEGLQDKNIYLGQFKKGKRHGIGIMLCADGSLCQGYFKDDFIEGPAYMVYPGGATYSGFCMIDQFRAEFGVLSFWE